MHQINNIWIFILILIVGKAVGIIRGNEARRKWIFKIKNHYEEKRTKEEQKKLLRAGGVPLDEIELAAFHN